MKTSYTIKSRFLFSLIFFQTLLSVMGQQTINRSNYFILGNSYNFKFIENIDQAQAIMDGNNVEWDLSTIVQTTQLDTLNAIDPSTTVFFDQPDVNYNISDLCLLESFVPIPYNHGENLYSYYLSDTQSVQFLGRWYDNPLNEVYYHHLSDPEKYFEFPFSYGDSFQDSYTGSYYEMSGSGSHTFEGITEVVADGYGTLYLSSMVYTDCLRIKSIKTGTDTSSIFGTVPFNEYTYTWFQSTLKGPILEIITNSNFNNVRAKYYYENQSIGLNELYQGFDLTIFPNPVSNFINIDDNIVLKINSLKIFSIFGNLILERKHSFSKINVEQLNSGIYIVLIDTENGIVVKKVVKV